MLLPSPPPFGSERYITAIKVPQMSLKWKISAEKNFWIFKREPKCLKNQWWCTEHSYTDAWSCLISASIHFSTHVYDFMPLVIFSRSWREEGRRGGRRLGLLYCLILSASKAGGAGGGGGGKELWSLVLFNPLCFHSSIQGVVKTAKLIRDLSLGEGKPGNQGRDGHGSRARIFSIIINAVETPASTRAIINWRAKT